MYERRQAEIDILGELLRTLGEFMPISIAEILMCSEIADEDMAGDADKLLALVRDDLEQLKECYEELMNTADEEGHREIANYAQDQILDLAKSIWMLNSTLD